MLSVVISIVVLVVVLILGVPVPFTFLLASFILIIMGGYDYSFLLPYGFSKGTSIILCAIPLFILAGGIIERGKIGDAIVNWVSCLVGNVKGALGVILVIGCGFFGSISGSGAATISCIGSIMLPRMYEAGYPKGHCTALIASAGVLGLLIPPSLNTILYAWVAGASILACFLATVIPGIILIVLFSIINIVLLRNNQSIKMEDPRTFKETLALVPKRTFSATPAIIAPIIILGGIYSGFMTPTEAAGVACLYAIPVGALIYKGLTLKSFFDAVASSACTTGVVLIMLVSVQILSRLYIMEQVPMRILELLNTVSDNPVVCLLIINGLIVLIGMIMDDGSSILLATPLLLPVVSAFGISPVQFAAILGVNVGMANVTPPCAPFLYLACRIGKTKVNEVLKPTFILILFAWLPVLILTTYIPQFATWLPNLALGTGY